MGKPLNTHELMMTLQKGFEHLQLENEKEAAQIVFFRQNTELEKINNRLQALAEATKEIASFVRREEMCQFLLEKFAETMAVDGGSIYLVWGDALVLVHTLDPGHAPAMLPLPLNNNSVFAKAIIEKMPLLCQDIAEEQDVLGNAWEGYKNTSLLVFPMLAENRELLGIISLHNKNHPPFTAQDREIGSILVRYSLESLCVLKTLKELRRSQQNLQRLFDTLDDFLFIVDQNGMILYVNPAVPQGLEYSMSELTNDLTFYDVLSTGEEQVKAMLTDLKCDPQNILSLELVTKEEKFIPVEIKFNYGYWEEQNVLFGLARKRRTVCEPRRVQAASEKAI